jgi:hypothetical protein
MRAEQVLSRFRHPVHDKLTVSVLSGLPQRGTCDSTPPFTVAVGGTTSIADSARSNFNPGCSSLRRTLIGFDPQFATCTRDFRPMKSVFECIAFDAASSVQMDDQQLSRQPRKLLRRSLPCTLEPESPIPLQNLLHFKESETMQFNLRFRAGSTAPASLTTPHFSESPGQASGHSLSRRNRLANQPQYSNTHPNARKLSGNTSPISLP